MTPLSIQPKDGMEVHKAVSEIQSKAAALTVDFLQARVHSHSLCISSTLHVATP